MTFHRHTVNSYKNSKNKSKFHEYLYKNTYNKTVENKTVENKTVENKTVENKTVENKTVENKTVENKTVQNMSVQNTSYEEVNRQFKTNKYGLLWINLESSKDRYNHITQMLSNYCIKNYRINAINGKDINNIRSICDYNLESIISTNYDGDQGVLLSVTLSHLKAINECSKLNHEYFIICEDDIVFHNKVLKHLDKIVSDAPDFDILQLYSSCVQQNQTETYIKRTKETEYWGATCYIIPRKKLETVQNTLYKIVNNKFILLNRCTPIADYYIYENLKTYTYRYNIGKTLNRNSTIHPTHLSVQGHVDACNTQLINDNF